MAVVSHTFSPRVGGSERYHRFGARAVSEFANVAVFTSRESLRGAPDPKPDPSFAVEYLPSVRLATEDFVSPIRLWRALRKFDPDLVWGNHPSPTADVGALFALANGRPWIATYHADVGSDRWWKRLYLRAETAFLRKACRVLVTSERYAELLRVRGVPAQRLVVAPPGPYIGDGSPPATNATFDPALPPRFLFVGALDAGHRYKRLDLLLAAIAELRAAGRPVSLDVVGDGELRKEWEARAKHLGLAECVRFRGRLSDDDLAESFAAATALVLPAVTEAEGFGSVAVEAIQYGCPVVTSTRVSVGDRLESAGAGIRFDADRPETLAPVLRRTLDEPGLRERLAQNSRALAPRFAWSEVGPRIAAPIAEILTGRGSPGGRP
ncbi:MAG TPA: glycosyltransferase family 4 protein [Thermoplasmata archaeon]|nr:glycosyltransferase family 4 protein [Thermoplasmata archaeon]